MYTTRPSGRAKEGRAAQLGVLDEVLGLGLLAAVANALTVFHDNVNVQVRGGGICTHGAYVCTHCMTRARVCTSADWCRPGID